MFTFSAWKASYHALGVTNKSSTNVESIIHLLYPCTDVPIPGMRVGHHCGYSHEIWNPYGRLRQELGSAK